MYPLIVTGTGRSGTSTVAMTLHHNGCDMGWITESDTEDKDYRALNAARIRRQIDVDQWTQELKLLNAGRASNTAWGWKDPGASYFIRQIKELTPNATIVVTTREREAVIESLMRNYSMPRDRAERFHDGRVEAIKQAEECIDIHIPFEAILAGTFITMLPHPCTEIVNANMPAKMGI